MLTVLYILYPNLLYIYIATLLLARTKRSTKKALWWVDTRYKWFISSLASPCLRHYGPTVTAVTCPCHYFLSSLPYTFPITFIIISNYGMLGSCRRNSIEKRSIMAIWSNIVHKNKCWMFQLKCPNLCYYIVACQKERTDVMLPFCVFPIKIPINLFVIISNLFNWLLFI